MPNNSKNTHYSFWVNLSKEDIRKEISCRLKQQPKYGLYKRLVCAGLNPAHVTELQFIETKRGRAGYEYCLKVAIALESLPIKKLKP